MVGTVLLFGIRAIARTMQIKPEQRRGKMSMGGAPVQVQVMEMVGTNVLPMGGLTGTVKVDINGKQVGDGIRNS